MEWDDLLNTERRRPSARREDELRTEFQRDFDRALFSSSVRRLQDKAQVFPLERHDSIRTRLTHSHEVSIVARGLAEHATRGLIQNVEYSASIVAIAGTTGLLHDLGNPPFGHAGERAIATWFEKPEIQTLLETISEDTDGEQMVEDFKQFEGNAQTLRIVSRLQLLTDDNGLNLTYGSLSALRKYIAPSHRRDQNDAGRKKPGFFWSESDRVREIEQKTATAGMRHPITLLVEAADDIVYGAVDLEDGITKNIVSWTDFASAMDRANIPGDYWTNLKRKTEQNANMLEWREELRDLDRASIDSTYAQIFRTNCIGQFVAEAAEEFKNNYDEIMRGGYKRSLLDNIPSGKVYKSLKKFEQQSIYPSPPTLKLEILGRRVIHDLMSLFWEGVKDAGPDGPEGRGYDAKIWRLLSPSFRLVFKQALNLARGKPARENYARLRLVCDYVCGMTDSFACDLHRELYGC